jgi:hypothetical protein
LDSKQISLLFQFFSVHFSRHLVVNTLNTLGKVDLHTTMWTYTQLGDLLPKRAPIPISFTPKQEMNAISSININL